MADFEEQSLNGRNARAGRIRWSEQMNSDLSFSRDSEGFTEYQNLIIF